MSVRTIFPSFLPDLDSCVINFLKDSDLFALSRVSKYAHKTLNNSVFKKRFFAQHPYLENYENKIFKVLCQDHSDICWKVICDLFPSQSEQRDFSDGPHENFIPLKISLPLFIKAIPSICISLQLKKEQYASQLKGICDPHNEEPTCEVRRKWIQEYWSLQRKREEVFPWVGMPDYSEEGFIKILSDEIKKMDGTVSLLSTAFLPGSSEIVELLEKFGEYRCYFEAFQKEQNIADEYQCKTVPESNSDEDDDLSTESSLGFIENKYKSLRKKMVEMESELQGNLPLYCAYLAVFSDYQKSIQNEFKTVFCLAQNEILKLHLEQCVVLIEEAIKQPTDNLVKRIICLVNSLGVKEKSSIYAALCCTSPLNDRDDWFDHRLSNFYPKLKEEEALDECVDSGPFQKWLEFHVSTCLQELKKIVESSLDLHCEVAKNKKIE